MSEFGGIETLPIDLTEIIGELEIPCDYDRLFRCGPAAAEWLMVARCGCGVVGHRLTCASCKDGIMQTEGGLACPSCDMVFIPARKAFAYMEKL